MEETILDEINSLVTLEDRPVLDRYLDLVIEGVKDPFRQLAKEGKLKSPALLAEFLESPERQIYVSRKLAYFYQCADIDRIRLLQELRNIAFANPKDFLDVEEYEFTDKTGKERTHKQMVIKDLDEIPDLAFKAVKAIKYDKYGRPQLEFHDKMSAMNLLARMQKQLDRSDAGAKTEEEKPKLFDLAQAETADTTKKPEYADADGVLDAKFVENIRKNPEIVDEDVMKKAKKADKDRQNFSSDEIYGA